MRHESDTIMDVINLKTFNSFKSVSKVIGDTTQNAMIFVAFGSIFIEYFLDIDMPVVEIILVYGTTFMAWELFKWRIRAIIKKYEGVSE